MRVTRLYLRNYRVYEDELDLELPAGLVGVVGPNGSGKSALLESILWSLYGHSRTAKEEVRTADVNAECITEVEFEHEGHLYVVRRTLSGANATVRAQALADGAQVAEGVQAVRRYVHSVLGMDLVAFRASVFAEQKQLASFSGLRPGERKDLVLRLLGITPLDRARDDARRDARGAADTVDRIRQVLPDLDGLLTAADDLAAAAGARTAEEADAADVAAAALARLQEAQRVVEGLDALRREHDALVAEGRATRAEHESAAGEAARLAVELAGLAEVATRLPAIEAEAAGLAAAERDLRLVESAAAAASALAAVPPVEQPVGPDEAALEAAAEQARLEAEAAGARLAEVGGLLRGAVEAEGRARAAVGRAGELSGEGDCPLCGQSLGSAFEQVQMHRAAEVAEAAERVRALTAEQAELAPAAQRARAAAAAAVAGVRAARAAAAAHQQQRARRDAAERALAEAEAVLGRPAVAGEADVVGALVGQLRAAASEAERMRGRLDRQAALEQAVELTAARVADAAGRLEILREKVKALGFRPEQLQVVAAARDQARDAADVASTAANRAAVLAGEARARAEGAAAALATGREQHVSLDAAAEQARHLGRLAQLLSAFRDSVVATVGPQLSRGAAELFAELTDNEYDRLEVDPLSYEIQIRDRGRLYGMARFSGSETDLANLALRVAISEHVRLLSGGAVGLLVLDEVFGPLDDDRKQRMLAALERLRSRFRQVLVVTHDDAVKAELPSVIEVVRLPGHRATARLLNA